jgi:hypothetical protein
MEFWADLAHELMRLKPSKLPYFQKDLRAMALIQSDFELLCHPFRAIAF